MYLFLSVCLLLHFDIYLVIRVHRTTGKIGMCVRVCINLDLEFRGFKALTNDRVGGRPVQCVRTQTRLYIYLYEDSR